MLKLVRPLAVALCGLALFAADGAVAQQFPSRPVHWIVGYPPGGTTDLLARITGQYLSEKLGQQFIIENKPGAGNNIATDQVAKAAPDGYTVLLVNPANGINVTLYEKLPFDFLRDIQPVGGLIRVPNVMEVWPGVPAKNVKEFIDWAKANKGHVNMASSGSGTSVHLSGEMFKMMTGIEMTHVPYRGAGPALIDLVAGSVHVIFDNLPSSIEKIKSGQLRALGVTTNKRASALPDVPPISDTVPGYEASAWFGMGAPKGTPKAAIDVLNKAINQALADPKFKAKMVELGGDELLAGTPEDFGKVMKSEVEKWAKVVKASGAKVE